MVDLETLIELGEKTILQLTPPQNKAARIAQATFAEHRDFVTGEHAWNFATERLSLPASATPPAYGYGYAYPLPSSVLRVLPLEEQQNDPWKVEAHEGVRAILTDLGAPLEIRAIVRVEDLNRTTALFRGALATYCAAQWAEALTGTTSVKVDKMREFAAKLSLARSADGREGTIEEYGIRNSWLDAR